MTQIRRLRLEDLDRGRGQLRVRRPGRLDHVACLDELPMDLVTTGITERVERWPDSANPYLMVSRQTAVDDLHPHVSQDVIRTPFQRAGHQAGQAPAGPALRRGPGNRRPCPSHGLRRLRRDRDEIGRRCPPRQEGRPDPSLTVQEFLNSGH
ncbi:hypothetical protein ABT167_30435 [Streptomyces sp. NPDC001792]|uniref:hypothetical protein n=1 Tax=Streptomyces sp. NPDC001792 TaxID=3154524 RepID=UPI00332BF164